MKRTPYPVKDHQDLRPEMGVSSGAKAPRRNTTRFANAGDPAERCRQLLTKTQKEAETRFFSPWRSRSGFA